MPDQNITRSIESDAAPSRILQILENPKRLPEWAPAFADKIERDRANQYKVTKNGAAFALEMSVERTSRTVDYVREIAPGQKGGAFIRVLPRPCGGSVVVMTLQLPANANPDQAAATLQQELPSLLRLLPAKAA